MKIQVAQAVLELLRARVRALNERTAIAKFARINAAIRRDLPLEQIAEDESVPLAFLESLIVNPTTPTAEGGTGERTGTQTEPTSGGGSPAGPATPVPASPPTTPTTGTTTGPDRSGDGGTGSGEGTGITPGTGPGHPGASGITNTVTVGNGDRWTRAAIATAIAGGLGLSAMAGYGLSSWTSPSPVPQVIQTPSGEQSLYQWLEDQGYHLPPEE